MVIGIDSFIISRMAGEEVDLKQLGIVGRSKEQILQELEKIYKME